MRKCPHCDFSHWDPRVVFGEKHQKIHWPDAFKCPACDYETDNPQSLHGHLLSKHQASKMERIDIIAKQIKENVLVVNKS